MLSKNQAPTVYGTVSITPIQTSYAGEQLMRAVFGIAKGKPADAAQHIIVAPEETLYPWSMIANEDPGLLAAAIRLI